jgi:hypothetical protein
MKSIEKTKRKYDGMSGRDIHLLKSIKKENDIKSRLKSGDNIFIEDGILIDAKIYDFDILLLIGNNLYLRQRLNKNCNIQTNGILLSSNVTDLKYVNLAVMIGGTRDVIICNNLSEIILITIDINGKIITNEFSLSINIEDRNNDVISIHHNGTVVIIGTSNGNLFILERDGRIKIKNTFKLENPKTLFEWGKNILGFNYEDKEDTHMIKMIQIPYIKEYNNKNMFLFISNNNIALWNNIYLQGKETFHWQENLNEMIVNDIKSSNDSSFGPIESNLVIMDALLIPNEEYATDEKVSVMVLSYFTNEDSFPQSEGSKEKIQLWIHKIDFNLNNDMYMNDSLSSNICIRNSNLIDYRVELSNNNKDNVIQPKLNYYASSHSPTSLFYVSYFKSHKPTGHDTLYCELFITYIKIKSSQHHENSNLIDIKTEKTEYSHEISTCREISSSSIISLGTVRDSGSIYLLQQDGGLICKIIDADDNIFDDKMQLNIKILNDIILSKDNKDYISLLSKLPNEELVKSIKDLSDQIDGNAVNGLVWAGHIPSLLSQYQEIFNSLKDKSIGLSRILMLISLLMEKKNDNTSLTLLFNEINLTYQKLHGCMKLCKIIYEKKNELNDINNIKDNNINEDSVSIVTRNSYFIKGTSEAILLLDKAIELSVMNIGDENKFYDISSKGIGIIDDFFSSSKYIVFGFNNLRNELLDQVDLLKQKFKLVPTVYNLITIFLSIIHTSNEEKDQEVNMKNVVHKRFLPLNKNSFICMKELHILLIELVKILRDSISQSVDFEELFSNEQSNESKNIYELCRIILQKYELELNSSNDYGEKMGNEWKRLYNDSKHITVYLLLELGHYDNAYKISKDFFYFPGLMEVNAKDSSYYNNLIEFIYKNKKIKGTSVTNLIEFCFAWCEKSNNIPTLLDIGKIDENQLNLFISSRPHLAIIHSLNKKNFSLASELSIKNAKNNDILLSQSLYSVGKLANIVAENHNNQSTLFSLKQSDNRNNFTENVNNHLVFINLQLEIVEYNPDIYALCNVEQGSLLPYSVLINEYINIIEGQHIESFSIPFSCSKNCNISNSRVRKKINNLIFLLFYLIISLYIGYYIR